MKRSAIKRTAWLPKRRPLPLRSAKKIAAGKERAVVVARLREERRGCEAMSLLRVAAHKASGKDQEAYVKALRSCPPRQPGTPASRAAEALPQVDRTGRP